MLKTLELRNVGKHSHLIVNFTDGINIIHGDSDAGKSWIIKAIKFLYYNEAPKKDAIRKERTKKTSIKGIFDNGIEIERIKSKTTNAYILIIPGNKPERFDAIGKVVPDRIKEILQTQTIQIENDEIILNIADQMTMPFLLDKSGGFRMKLFNKLAGSDIIDKTMVSLNKDILHIGREEKLEKEHLEEQEKNLKELTEKKEKCQVVYDLFTTSYNELKEKLSTYEVVNDYSQKLNSINKGLEEAKLQLNEIHTIKEAELLDLNQKIDKLEKLNELLYKIKSVKKELLSIEEQLKKTVIPEININDIRDKIEKLTKLQKTITRLNDIITTDDILITKTDSIVKQIKEDSKKWQELLKKAGICPMCKRIVKQDEEIKL